MAQKYIQIPKEVEALQFTTENISQMYSFTNCNNLQILFKNGIVNGLIIIDGVKLLIVQGDYLVKSKSDILVIKQEEFETNYKLVEEVE